MKNKNLNKSVIILLIVITILALTTLLNIKIDGEALKLSGLSVILGIIAYFATKGTNESKTSGLEIKSCLSNFKNKKVILLSVMPFILNILCMVIAKAFLPEFVDHLNNRISFLNTSEVIKTILTLAIATLGEEIAWRAFFQKQTSKIMKFVPSLMITSVLFSIAHLSSGTFIVVVYDLLFVFLNSLFYGLVFKNTDNAFCSWIPHFLADVFALFII